MSGAAPSRSLRGARPSPLSLSKQSHNITKQKRHPPPPVIIYAVSPKKINVEPGEFKAVVQRLTGLNPSSSPGPALIDGGNGGGGAFPAEISGGSGFGMPQNLLWNGNDFDNLHGNINVNNLMMNLASSSSTSNFDVINYFYDI